jgi:uncharacterized protein DUF1569
MCDCSGGPVGRASADCPIPGKSYHGKTAQLYTQGQIARRFLSYDSVQFAVCEVDMKNLFEREAVDELISRIDNLKPAAQRQWGKMDVGQMMAHCSAALDMASGKLNPPRIFIGRILGPFVKPIYTNEKNFSQNNPTDKKLVIRDVREFTSEQARLKDCVRGFHEGGEAKCTRHPHPFFGALTPQEWSRGMYKHLDHHLRQFGA